MAESGDTIGDRLDHIRRREGLTQGDFADVLGISRSSLQNYLRNERDISSSLLLILSDKFEVDPTWVLQGEKEFEGQRDVLLDQMDRLERLLREPTVSEAARQRQVIARLEHENARLHGKLASLRAMISDDDD